MTTRSLLERGFAKYAEHGAIRSVGVVAKFCGTEVHDRCETIYRTRKRDSGKGYPLALRLRAARHGFSAHSYLLLGLETADADRYLSSVRPIRDLNSGHVTPIHNKYVFQMMTEPHGVALPALYGRLDDGGFASAPAMPHRDGLFDVLDRVGDVVLKPMKGGRGAGVHTIRRVDGEITVDGRPRRESAVADFTAGLDEYLVTEFVDQHRYADSIFPDATNTVRVFSLIDPETGDPSVVRAGHRFGSAASAPTDNASRGGFLAPVDVRTGTIKRLIELDGRSRSKVDCHPESGVQIAGVTIPYWDDVRELVRTVADVHRDAPLVGWDVVIAEDGPVLLEGNARPGRHLLQLERGILDDPRARRLLGAEHGN